MKIADLYPIIGRPDYGIAATLEQLLFYSRRAGGECQIRLSHMSRFIRRSTSAISRYLQWLADQGFIRIRREFRGNACILYVRTCIRLRDHKEDGTANGTERDGDGTAMGRYTQGEPKENTPDTVSVPERAGVAEMRMKGSVSDVPDRLKQKQEVARARTRAKPPTPLAAAHEWNSLLREYGYPEFDPNSGKHLAHIKRTFALFSARTMGGFITELEKRIGRWPDIRPKKFGKTPPHPWAVNRFNTLVADDAALEFTDAQKATLANPVIEPAVDKSVDKADNGPQLKPEQVTGWKPVSKWIKDQGQ